MNKLYSWSLSAIILAGIGIILILFSILTHSSFTLNIGGVLFSLAGMMVGIEAILRRKIILRSPYNRRLSETYIGITAVAQGLLVILTGCFLIILILIHYFSEAQNLFHHFIRRPGIPLIFLSSYCILTAIFMSIGSIGDKQGTKLQIIQKLITSHFLSSFILIVLGLLFFFLGVLEIFNPVYFDSLGGSLLEVIFLSEKK